MLPNFAGSAFGGERKEQGLSRKKVACKPSSWAARAAIARADIEKTRRMELCQQFGNCVNSLGLSSMLKYRLFVARILLHIAVVSVLFKCSDRLQRIATQQEWVSELPFSFVLSPSDSFYAKKLQNVSKKIIINLLSHFCATKLYFELEFCSSYHFNNIRTGSLIFRALFHLGSAILLRRKRKNERFN